MTEPLALLLDGTNISPTMFGFMILSAFVSAIYQSVSGLAGALLLVIILSPFLGIKVAVPLVAVSTFVSNIARYWVFRHQFNLPVFLSIIVTALPGMIIGALAFVALPVQTLAFLIGLFLLASIPGRRFMTNKGIVVGRLGFSAVGGIYGLVGGVTMGAGLILAPFFLGAGITGGQIVALTSLLGTALNFTKIVVFGASPLLTIELLIIGLIIGLIAAPGAYIGRWILKSTSVRAHTLLVEGIMGAGAAFFFWQAFTG